MKTLNTSIILSTVLVLLTFSACNKSNDEPTTSTQSKKLLTSESLVNVYSSQGDFNYYYRQFGYNSYSNLSTVSIGWAEWPTDTALAGIFEIVYKADRLGNYTVEAPSVNSHYTFVYDLKNRVSKIEMKMDITAIGYIDYDSIVYNDKNQIAAILRYTNSAYGFNHVVKVYQTINFSWDTNDNLLRLDYLYSPDAKKSSLGLADIHYRFLSYDNKINPFYNNVDPLFWYCLRAAGDEYFAAVSSNAFSFSKNNWTKMEYEAEDFGVTLKKTRSYTYDSVGYPVSCYMEDTTLLNGAFGLPDIIKHQQATLKYNK
ncbi:hypothetical protein [Pinibacter aurantiacus]|uniref:DUF4595 domain-containing protein n=1 Tax=Pinibacter aurantiacus TaxID=2851599 RepID=A0A9E2SGT5_9BACT|nr:hypothetical protein [Pinibacter aurantiacus]MBV4360550.1 hypothetical protein [Pinibacter aurantiacus]